MLILGHGTKNHPSYEEQAGESVAGQLPGWKQVLKALAKRKKVCQARLM